MAQGQWGRLLSRWKMSKELFMEKPLQFLSIPVIAAGVGYVTNYLGVNMLFYPLEDNLSYKRWPDQPVGLFGWQGIVPCKRVTMATTLVDVSLTKLLKISEIFARLDPAVMADILKNSMANCVLGGIIPVGVVRFLLDKVATAIIADIEKIVSIKEIVVVGLTTDPSVLGAFFQQVGKKELEYLINSGTYFGFLLGLLQMTQLMLFPANWTLPVSGAVVGFMTNWIALQLIFKPIEPMPFTFNEETLFTIQGFCLARQKEVSVTFSEYIASNVLTSEEIWREMLFGAGHGKLLRKVITDTLPFLPSSVVDTIMATLRSELVSNNDTVTYNSKSDDGNKAFLLDDKEIPNVNSSILPQNEKYDKENTKKVKDVHTDIPAPSTDSTMPLVTACAASGGENSPLAHLQYHESLHTHHISHPLHTYIDTTMRLEETLVERMNLLTPTEFERILHPIFEEDELTLIIAGGILGFAAGAFQWWIKVAYENYQLHTHEASNAKHVGVKGGGGRHLAILPTGAKAVATTPTFPGNGNTVAITSVSISSSAGTATARYAGRGTNANTGATATRRSFSSSLTMGSFRRHVTLPHTTTTNNTCIQNFAKVLKKRLRK